MIELLQKYSIVEIIVFFTVAAVSIKGFVTFWDWTVDRLRKVFKKETQEEKIIEDFEERFKKHEQLLEALSLHQKENSDILANLTDKINLLLSSDKDDIKSYITEKYHFFCEEQKWIDDYSLECIEKRFEHYKQEGGNSFIKDLISKIRELPTSQPKEE